MKLCKYCGSEFDIPRAAYCSAECRRENIRESNRRYAAKRRREDPEYRERQRQHCRSSYAKTGMTPRHHFSSLRGGARKRDYVFEITFENFLDITAKPCYYCNRDLQVGVDRIDNTEGYILENCRPCCKHCNHAKRDMTEEQFYDLIRRIYETRCQTVRA